MGAPMALHLLKAGHQLFVHTRSKLQPEIADSRRHAVRQRKGRGRARRHRSSRWCPTRPTSRRCCSARTAWRPGLSKGKTVVDMSSISPIETKAFAQKINALGCDYLDAPVSGGEVGAKAASLTIMVGGPEAAFDRVKPLFELMGKNITLVGGNGDGQTTKVANQIIVALNIAAVGEALVFASKAGADPAKVRQALMGGFAASRILEVHGERMIKRTFNAGLSHRAAPEGPEPGAGRRARAGRGPAADGRCGAADAGLRRQRHAGPGPLGAGARAGADGEPRGAAKADRSRRSSLDPQHTDPRGFLRALYDAAVARALPARTPPPSCRRRPRAARWCSAPARPAVRWPLRSTRCGRRSAPLSGLVVTRYDHVPPAYKASPGRIEVVEAAHPVPDEAGRRAAQRIVELTQGLTADDLVLCLISRRRLGAAGAAGRRPDAGGQAGHQQGAAESGAAIDEMNCVRKHLSAIKGGRLAARCAPARVVTLLISDVPGDAPEVIASGPTVPDSTTCADALRILQRYGIEMPAAARAGLESGAFETPKPGDPRFAGHEVHMIATPQQSLEAAAALARAAGVEAHILSDEIEGESREVGKVHAALARSVARRGTPFAKPCVILSAAARPR